VEAGQHLISSSSAAEGHPCSESSRCRTKRHWRTSCSTLAQVDVRLLDGEESAIWWERAVAAYPDYADYQSLTDRVIPVLLATPRA
jgi:anti-sigma factor RsiW